MAKKKTQPPAGPARPVAETPSPEAVRPEPAAGGALPDAGLRKGAAIAVLAILVAGMAYYFHSQPQQAFAPGPQVDEGTFKDIFANASAVSIVMDVRGAGDNATSRNILQCGVDFAGSTGMGGKAVSPFSISGEGCVAQDGPHPVEWCVSRMRGTIVIYVRGGSGVSYHTDSMVVGIGTQYPLGSCGIKRL